MPFISIIIPTHNNEEHIEQAILSCFDSDFDDFEVIVVDDASTDKTPSLIRKTQARYKTEMKIIKSPQQNGLGETRNIGLRVADGKYIMFLDGDDWYEPKAIDIVAKKLKQIQPDVLMFNHQRVWTNGAKAPNIPNKYVDLSDTEKDISDRHIRKGAIRNLHSACNKTYKKEFIEINCGEFHKGFYEDFSWSIKAVTNARKIYFIPDLVFNYRQRDGSITRSSSYEHFQIFTQIQEVQIFLDRNPTICSSYGKEIYEYTKSLLYGIIKVGYRIPANKNYEFIRKTHQTLSKLRKTMEINYFDIKLLASFTGNTFLFKLTSKLDKE